MGKRDWSKGSVESRMLMCSAKASLSSSEMECIVPPDVLVVNTLAALADAAPVLFIYGKYMCVYRENSKTGVWAGVCEYI